MLRRLALTAAVSLAALAAVPGAASADGQSPVGQSAAGQSPGERSPGERPSAGPSPDRLTVTVSDSGVRAAEGTHELRCGPDGAAAGTLRSPQEACDRLAALAAEGRDPFAPIPRGMMCTMQYGGPATAHITGSWRGQPVDATFRRTNGCEIARWNNLEPVLPHAAL